MTPREFFEWTLAASAGALMTLVVIGFMAWLYLHLREAYWAQREVELELIARGQEVDNEPPPPPDERPADD